MDVTTGPVDHRAIADELYAKRDFVGAAEAYRKVLERQQTSASALMGLGLSLVLSGQIEEGVEACMTAANLQPSDAEVRYSYGYALGAARRWEEAIAELDAALYIQTNHMPARNGLIYCLLTAGQELLQTEPQKAELMLDRAHKLDPRNPHVIAALLQHFGATGQVGKGSKLVQSLDDGQRMDKTIMPVITNLERDPKFQIALRQVSVQRQAAGPNVSAAPPPAAQSQLQQVPCPNCRQPIMSFAAICPHCNFQNRPVGSFQGRDTGPAYAWQDIAYTIMAVLWTAMAGWDLFNALVVNQKAPGMLRDYTGFLAVMAGARVAVGLGLLFRMEWMAFIAKILVYITLLLSSIQIMITLFTGQYVALAISIATAGIAGFMIYLINYVMGD